MARSREHDEIEAPDVTPLINVNLVILVFSVIMVCNSAKLLPLLLPKAPPSITCQACVELNKGKPEGEKVNVEHKLTDLRQTICPTCGHDMSVIMCPKCKKETKFDLVKRQCLTCKNRTPFADADLGIMYKTEFVEMFVKVDDKGQKQKLNPDVKLLKVEKDGSYTLTDAARPAEENTITGLNKESLMGELSAMAGAESKEGDGKIILMVTADAGAKYEAMVNVLDDVMSYPRIKVTFGETGSPVAASGPATAPAGEGAAPAAPAAPAAAAPAAR